MTNRKHIEKNFKKGKYIYYIKEFSNFTDEFNLDIVALKKEYELSFYDDYLVYNPSGLITNNISYHQIYLTEKDANKALAKIKKAYAKLKKKKEKKEKKK